MFVRVNLTMNGSLTRHSSYFLEEEGKHFFHKKKVNLFFFLVAAVAAVLCDGMEFVHEHFSREQATLSSCPLMNINLSYKEFYNEKAKM